MNSPSNQPQEAPTREVNAHEFQPHEVQPHEVRPREFIYSERIVHSPEDFQPSDLAAVIEYVQAHPGKSLTESIKAATQSRIETDDIRDFIAEFKARVVGGPKIP